jgi:MFS family permease
MWELYAMWTWMPAFATAWVTAIGRVPSRQGSLIAFITIFSGAVGCVVAGRWADTWGKARVAGGSMVVSAACCVLAGVMFGSAPALLIALAVVWGFSVVSDSAQFSALVSEGSPRTHVGTALTLQLCAGFLLTMPSIQVMPAHMGWAGGWRWVFLALVPGPVLGALAMKRLSALRTDAGSRKPGAGSLTS